jgi:hypothetical protein
MAVHFVVEDAWEVKDPILKSLQAGAGGRLFPCVEVDLNQPIWHLDLQFHAGEGVTHWRRFILSSVEQVAATIEEHHGTCRLHLQSARMVGRATAYEMWAVQGLQTAQDRHGRLFHVVKLSHEKLVYPDHNVQDSELFQHHLIYDAHTQALPA